MKIINTMVIAIIIPPTAAAAPAMMPTLLLLSPANLHTYVCMYIHMHICVHMHVCNESYSLLDSAHYFHCSSDHAVGLLSRHL